MDFARKRSFYREWSHKGSAVSFVLILTGIVLLVVLVYFLLISFSGRTNILLVGPTITLVSFDHDQRTVSAVLLPENLYIHTTGGRGQVTVGSLFKLDEVSRRNGSLMTSTIRELLGVPIDGWIWVTPSLAMETAGDIELIVKREFNPVNFESILTEIKEKKSSFDPVFLRRLYFEISSIGTKTFVFRNISDSAALSDQQLPDESTVLVSDEFALDNYLSEMFFEIDVLKESLSISILNGAETFGLAHRVARLVKNIGGNVVVVDNSDYKDNDCILRVKPESSKTYTVVRLKKIYNCRVAEDSSIVNERADIVIILGRNYEREIIGG